MTAPRTREQADPPDRQPPRRGGGSSLYTYDVSAAGQPADLARLAGARRGLVRITLLLVASLRVPLDVARGIWNLPDNIRAFRQMQDGLLELSGEDMLDRYFGAVGHELPSEFAARGPSTSASAYRFKRNR